MIIVPPEVFDKWKHIILDDESQSDLDKQMKSIILNKTLNNIDKWHHYREVLLKYSFMNKTRLKDKIVKASKPLQYSTETQTRFISTNEIGKPDTDSQSESSEENEIQRTFLAPINDDDIFESDDANQVYESADDTLNNKESYETLEGFKKKEIRKEPSASKGKSMQYVLSNGRIVTRSEKKRAKKKSEISKTPSPRRLRSHAHPYQETMSEKQNVKDVNIKNKILPTAMFKWTTYK